MITPEAIQQRIAELQAARVQVEMQAVANLNSLDGQIAALKWVLEQQSETVAPPTD